MMAHNRRITNGGFEKESPKTLIPKLFAFAGVFGFLFGYDTAITGCVASNLNFLRENFPHYKNLMSQPCDSKYLDCKLFDDGRLSFYRSSMYLVAFLLSSVFAIFPGHRSDKAIYGCLICIAGSLLSGPFGFEFILFFVGRITFCIGIGILILFVTTRLCELAPSIYHTRLNMWFQLSIIIGILSANIVYLHLGNPMVGDYWCVGLASSASVPLILIVSIQQQKPRSHKMIKIGFFMCHMLSFLFEHVAFLPPSDPVLPTRFQFLVLFAAGFGIFVSSFEYLYDELLKEEKLFGLLAAVAVNGLVVVVYCSKQNGCCLFTLGMAAVVVASRLDEMVKVFELNTTRTMRAYE